MTIISAAACEYVIDDIPDLGVGSHDVESVSVASEAVMDYLRKRVSAVLRKFDGERPVLMLSGGVDSILLATVLAEQNPDTVAVHYVIAEDPIAEAEARIARAVSERLGLRFIEIRDTHRDFALAAATVSAILETPDIWETVAGTILKRCADEALSLGYDGPIFTGAGADALFNGGADIDADEWGSSVLRAIRKNFTYHRNIPDFYERLLTRPDTHIQVWQTHAAVQLAQRLSPQVVRGDGVDKKLFRELAVAAGMERSWVYTEKNPMQLSSGGVAALSRVAREDVASNPKHRAYTDPQTEPAESVIARMWLDRWGGV